MPETDSKASVQPSSVAETKPTSSRAKWWISELISLAVVLAAVTAARSSLADHYYVPSGSMEYSLMPGDRVIVNKMSYGLRIPLTKIDIFGSSTPERGEIAVFDSPEDGTTRLIKRIVAIGGDRVSVVNGQLSINGQPLGDRSGRALRRARRAAEPDAAAADRTSRSRCPPGMVLAMGDHRGNSNDGRKFGFIDERELFGRAVAIYYRRGDGFTWKPL